MKHDGFAKSLQPLDLSGAYVSQGHCCFIGQHMSTDDDSGSKMLLWGPYYFSLCGISYDDLHISDHFKRVIIRQTLLIVTLWF